MGKGLVTTLPSFSWVLAWHLLPAFNVVVPSAAQKKGEMLVFPIGNGELKRRDTGCAAQLQEGTGHKSFQP